MWICSSDDAVGVDCDKGVYKSSDVDFMNGEYGMTRMTRTCASDQNPFIDLTA